MLRFDADIWFLQCPQCIFDEFDRSGKDVYITEHAYSPEYDQTALSGKYCVQFIIFSRDGGEIVRKYWEDCCIECCNAKPKDGKFGDQKYLDEWPVKFRDKVHVARQKEWFLGPWNATRFPYSDAVIWHFHGFVVGKNYLRFYQGYKIPKQTYINVYKKYMKSIEFHLADSNLYIEKELSDCSLYIYLFYAWINIKMYARIVLTFVSYSRVKK